MDYGDIGIHIAKMQHIFKLKMCVERILDKVGDQDVQE